MSLCCFLVAVALLVQVVVWGLVSFTDLRFAQVAPPPAEAVPLVVTKTDRPARAMASAIDVEAKNKPAPKEVVDPNRVTGKHDRIFAMVAALASGFGALAVLALIPLIGLGVLLAASSATEGVDRTVSAFGWALVVGLLVMPIGDTFGLPWQGGALWSYDHLVAGLPTNGETVSPVTSAGLAMIARYLLLPLTCLLGIALVSIRFSGGIRAGAYQAENLQLDPQLEQEAGGVKPGSNFMGGRAAAAMRAAMDDDSPPGAKLSQRTAPQADTPKRLI